MRDFLEWCVRTNFVYVWRWDRHVRGLTRKADDFHHLEWIRKFAKGTSDFVRNVVVVGGVLFFARKTGSVYLYALFGIGLCAIGAYGAAGMAMYRFERPMLFKHKPHTWQDSFRTFVAGLLIAAFTGSLILGAVEELARSQALK